MIFTSIFLAKEVLFFLKQMKTRKRTLEETTDMLQTSLEQLLVQNRHLCSLVSELSESVFEIEKVLTERQTPAYARKVAKAQLEADFGKDAPCLAVVEDSNSIPHVPHQPYPIEKFEKL